MTTSPGPFEIGAKLQTKEEPILTFTLLEYMDDDMLYVESGNEQGMIALKDVEAVPAEGQA